MVRYGVIEPETPFGKRIVKLLELTTRAELRDKKRLFELVNTLVTARIQSGYERQREAHASRSLAKSFSIFLGKSQEEYNLELHSIYQRRRRSIEEMQVDQLFELIGDLKNDKRALVNILNSIRVKKA